MLTRRFLIATTLIAAIAGCATRPEPVSVADTIARTPTLGTLNGLIAKAGMADSLRAPGPFTVFAPSDEAFKAVSATVMADLNQHPEKLKAVIAMHVVPAKMLAADVRTSEVKNLQGAKIAVSRAGEFVTVEDAMVQTPDLLATNGVVHVIDRVLMPASK